MALAQRQPLRQVGAGDAATKALQDAVWDWIVRQWATGQTPFGQPTTTKLADYSARLGELVLTDATAAAFTVWLPPVSQTQLGQCVTVKDVSGTTNVVTVRPAADGATIGSASYIELAEWDGACFVALSPAKWGTM
jgi:hypothetical protein